MTQADVDLAKEIGERLVPEVDGSQIIPADAVFIALGEEPESPSEPS